MFEVFQKHISDKANLTTADLEMIEALSVSKRLRKKQYLLQEGNVCRYHSFITEGCLRQYRVDDTGAEFVLKQKGTTITAAPFYN